MNDPRKYPNEVKECWSIHQVLRSLGFSPDDIYVMLAKDAQTPHDNSSLFVVLKENSREFTVTLEKYRTEDEAKKTMAVWSEFAARANAQKFDQKILEEIFNSSHVMRNKVAFLAALQSKGFLPCRGTN